MNKRGSILIVTLWVLSILAIFAVNLGYTVRTQLFYAHHLQDRLKMYYMARAGIERAIIELMNINDETESYDALNETWANNEELFKEMPFGDGFITFSYLLRENEEDEQTTLYGVMDESSKIDINNVPIAILTSLLERIGEVPGEEAIDIAGAIVDWRDKDIVVSPGGAEDEYYQGLDLPYNCKNGKFQISQELLLVKGMTPEIFSKIKEVITVYGTERVNINTASFTTFYALGLGRGLCESIIEFRQGKDGKIGTEDDFIFKSIEDLRETGPLFTEESIEINRLTSSNMLTVKSDIFRINSSGQLREQARLRSRDIVCVLKRQKGKESEILYWYED